MKIARRLPSTNSLVRPIRFTPHTVAPCLAARSSRLYGTSKDSSSNSSDPSSDSGSMRDAQLDRTKIDRQSNEYSKSGTDDNLAAQSRTSFDPTRSNDPADSRVTSGHDNSSNNPLDVSPANREISQGTEEETGFVTKRPISTDETSSQHGSSKLKSKVKIPVGNAAYAGSDTRRKAGDEGPRTPKATAGAR